MTRKFAAGAVLAALLPSLALFGACSTGAPSDQGLGGAGGAGEVSETAVMVSLLVPGVEASSFYVGVYPALPSELDTSQMLEVRQGFDARAFAGSIYVWEGDTGTYTRYLVGDRLELIQDITLSFRELGGTGTVMTSFVSEHLAYSLTRAENEIIVWDPTEMAILGSISGAALTDPNYPELDFGEPSIFGDYIAWPIQWADSINGRFSPELGVVLVSMDSMDPAIVVRDPRCGGGWMAFVDEVGDLYVTGNAIFGYAHFFGEGAESYPEDCVLRIEAGTTEFDPDYYRNLGEATGSPAVYHPWHVSGHTLLAAVLDPADDPAELTEDNYWVTPMQRKLVMLDDETSRELEGIPKSSVWSTLSHRLDDTLYMLSTEGVAFGGNGDPGSSKLYAVTEDGAELVLSSKGFLWSIGRVR